MQKPIKCQRKANFFVVNQSPYSDIFDTETMQIVCCVWNDETKNPQIITIHPEKSQKPKKERTTNQVIIVY